MRILFLVSGVYPHYMGGVSTWADQLLRGLGEHEFHVVSVVSNPHVEVRYAIPPNVREIVTIPLWGTEKPEEYLPGSPGLTLRNAWRTTEGSVRTDFVPHFESFLRQVKVAAPAPERLAEALYRMHGYLMEHDFRRTMRSRAVWNSFRGLVEEDPLLASLDLYEAISTLRSIGRYLRVLNVRPPEVDVAHSAIASVAGLVGIMAHLEYGTPNILTEHGVYVRERMLDLINQPLSPAARVFWTNFHAALAALNYRYAERIYPVCAFNSRWEEQFGVPSEKVQVVYNGVDGDMFRPRDVARDRPGPTVVAVIRIDRLKDALNLIEAMGHVRDAIPEARCLIYGPSPDVDYARLCVAERERRGLEDVVEFCGYTREPELAYNRGDVVVMSSVSEGFPFALLEGMASEKAIVATDVGGVGEALGDAGVLVPPRQPRRLGEAIIRLLKNPKLRQELGAAARARALSRYGVAGFIEAYRQVYAEVGGAS